MSIDPPATYDQIYGTAADDDPDCVPAEHDPFLGDTTPPEPARPPTGGDPAPPPAEPVAQAGVDGLRYTDSGNAERLIRDHGDALRYVPAWRRWLRWDGQRWHLDEDHVQVLELAKDVARRLLDLVPTAPMEDRKKLVSWATKSEMVRGLNDTITAARSLPGIAVDHADLDADPWLLNVTNGVVDLRTGHLLAPSPDRLITRLAPVEYIPGADAPTFRAFLERIIPDPDVRAYLQRFVGYTLTGSVREQVLGILWGDGRNGKSTFLAMLEALLGVGTDGYSTTIGRDLLIVQKHEAHDTRYVDLFRARLASCSELRDGASLDEARVKALTGGDRIRARRMREDFWSFDPSHKLVIATNHRPTITADDFAIWRRVHLVPFTETIPADDVDPQLAERIIATELPGVLAWALEGCLEWQADGLNPPIAVQAATDDYRAESDTVRAFIEDAGIGWQPGRHVASGDVQELHDEWCSEEGLNPRQHWQQVAAHLKTNGAKTGRNHHGRYWIGITLTPEHDAV